MTSAPKSARSIEQYGPGAWRERSTTRIPVRTWVELVALINYQPTGSAGIWLSRPSNDSTEIRLERRAGTPKNGSQPGRLPHKNWLASNISAGSQVCSVWATVSTGRSVGACRNRGQLLTESRLPTARLTTKPSDANLEPRQLGALGGECV